MALRPDIRTLARIHADQDASDFPTDAQYNILIDAAGRRVWVDLLRAGWPINFNTTTFVSNGATQYNPIPTPFGAMSIRGVFYIQGGERFELKRINEAQRSSLLSTTAVTGYSEFYDIRIDPTLGLVVELLPKSSGITYAIDYIPVFAGFGNDVTTWPGPIGSEDLVALQAAIFAVRKEGDARANEANMLKAEYKEQLEIVTDLASWVDIRNPARIRDVSTSHSRFAFDFPVAGPGDIYG